MRFILTLIFCLWCLLLIPAPVLADAGSDRDLSSGLIMLEGLSIYCPDCSRVDESYCELNNKGERILINCSNLLDYLLPALSLGHYDTRHPAPSELLTYLLREKLPYKRASASLILLGTQCRGSKAHFSKCLADSLFLPANN